MYCSEPCFFFNSELFFTVIHVDVCSSSSFIFTKVQSSVGLFFIFFYYEQGYSQIYNI